MPESGSMGSREGRPPPPSWMDAAFVEVALLRTGRRDVLVHRVEASYATAISDNYLGRVFRVAASVRGQAEPVALVVKCTPESRLKLAMVRERGHFHLEVRMYRKVVPLIEELLRAKLLSPPPLTARYFPAAADDVIILEDLVAQGFVMKNRFTGLDFYHAAAVMRALGRFHAASHVMLQKDEPELKPFQSPVQTPDKCSGWSTFVRNIALVVKSWEDMPSDLPQKIEFAAESVDRTIKDLTSMHEGALNVLNHGDMWTNNVMFRGKNEEIECRFVDLQMCFVGSPAVDLLTFQVTSLEAKGWRERWPSLVAEYWEALAEAARRLGTAAPPTLDDVHAELRRARLWTLVAAATWLPVILTAPDKFDRATFGAGGPRALAVVSQAYKDRLRLVLPYCDEIGVFDDLPM